MTVGTAVLIVIILIFFFLLKWSFRIAIVYLLAKAAGAAIKDVKNNLLGGPKDE